VTPFALFPQGVDASILPAVLVGLFVLLFLTETYGWVFAGLIVPGYLASVFVFSPLAGLAVVVEAVATFVVARAISQAFSRSGAGVEFFGRERFLLLLVVGVVVRQVAEFQAFPALSRLLDAELKTSLMADQALAGIGLVLVPITANSFWKLDVPRGLWQVGLPTLITYAIVAYVLLPWTNLSYAHQALTYEDAALDFLSSPKVYLILLAGAYFASRYNLDYGWDYNGILVPALLALTWFEPLRVLTTLGEALLLVALARGVSRLPWVRTRNLEGPRRIVFVFTLGLTLRALVSLALEARGSEVRAIDVFGYGYLLPSLLAAKMLQTKAIGRVLLPAAQVSLLGFVVGSVLALGFEFVLPGAVASESAPPERASTVLVEDDFARLAYGAAARALYEQPPGVRTGLDEVVAPLAALVRTPGAAQDAALADAVGRELVVERLAEGARAVREPVRSLARLVGRDTALVRPGAQGPIVEVRHPQREPETVVHAVSLCARVDCAVLAIAGVDVPEAPPPAWLLALRERVGRTRIVVRRARFGAADVVHADGAIDVGVPLASLLPGASVVLRGEPSERRHPAVVVRGSRAALLADVPPPASEPDVRVTERLFRAPTLREAPPPSDTELRVFSEFVVGPLLEGAHLGEAHTGPRVRFASAQAALLGLAVRHLPDGLGAGVPALLLASRDADDPRWGAFAVRLGPAEPILFTAPHPAVERGTERLAYALFEASRARAVSVRGEPLSDVEEPEVAASRGRLPSAHLAVHTAAHRVFAQENVRDALLAQVRGLGNFRTLPDALVVGVGAPLLDAVPPPPRLAALLAGPLAPFTPNRYVRGAADTLGLDGWHDPVARFAHDLGGPSPVLLWFSEASRRPFTETDGRAAVHVARGLGLETWSGGVRDFLALPARAARITATLDATTRATFAAAAEALARAATGEDPHGLRRLLGDGEARAFGGVDPVAGAGFLALELRSGDVVLRAVSFGVDATSVPLVLGPGDDVALARALLCRDRRIELVTREELAP
jgi:hypothetical protein